MLNHICLMGRITRDVELRYTGNETPVASFSIACDRDFTGRDAEKQTDFIECVAWRGTAEFISRNFKKGSMLAISGRLQTRSWQDKEGNKRVATEVMVENAYFGEPKRKDDGERSERSEYRPVDVSGADFTGLSDADDGELPF